LADFPSMVLLYHLYILLYFFAKMLTHQAQVEEIKGNNVRQVNMVTKYILFSFGKYLKYYELCLCLGDQSHFSCKRKYYPYIRHI
jgi:hypothetical protein